MYESAGADAARIRPRSSRNRRSAAASQPLLLAVDLGSSGLRASIAHATGHPIAVARQPLRSVRPPGGSKLAREFDPDGLRRAAGATIRSALRLANVSGRDISALGVTSQREGIALLDRGGRTLYVGPNNDLRGAFQGAAIDDTHASLIWKTTGHLPSFMLAWSKLAWFRDEAPAVYTRIACITSLADWLVHELTGELRLERALGVEAGLVDVASGDPAEALAARLGFESVEFPDLVNAGCICGVVSAGASDAYGIPGRLPVVIAGPDTQAGLVGIGVASPRDTGVIAGWSGTVQRVTNVPIFDAERGLWTGRHALTGRHVLEGNTGVMGGAFDWLVRLVSGGKTRSEDYSAIDRAALRKGRGAGSVSAHLGPDLVNLSKSSLRAGGIVFPVPLAFDPPDAGALGRAAIENFAFAIRANLERLATVAGSVDGASHRTDEDSSRVAVGGGMTRSATFRRVLADVTNEHLHIGSPDASLLGATTLTAAAIGVGPALDTALRARARGCGTVEPDPVAAGEYERLYEQWEHRGDVLAQIGV